MSASISVQKAELRERVRAGTRDLWTTRRAAASKEVCLRLRKVPEWSAARSVLLYMALADELDLHTLIGDSLRAGKIVAFPRFVAEYQEYVACRVADLANDLSVGRFGIREPGVECPVIPLNRLDFVAIPGIAFTLNGRRLGRGRGYYDRLLAPVSGTKCGVALDEQVVESIPVGAHDVQLDWIVTPSRSVRVSEGASRL